jgi:hypothetical protein
MVIDRDVVLQDLRGHVRERALFSTQPSTTLIGSLTL